jgi:hypothetical protein
MRKRKTIEEKCAWLKARQRPVAGAQLPPDPTPVEFPVDILEPKLSLPEVAALLQWGYHQTYRFWKDDPRTLVTHKPNPGKAPKMSYQVPKSAVLEQYGKMSAFNQKNRAA